MGIRFNKDQIDALGGPAQMTVCSDCQVTVTLDSCFSFVQGKRRWENSRVVGATVKLNGKTGESNTLGHVQFDFTDGIPDGRIYFEVTPREDQKSPGPAGPETASGYGSYEELPARLLRGFTGYVSASDNRLDPEGPTKIDGYARHARIFDIQPGVLTFDWRPDFICSRSQHARSRAVNLLVLHHTAGKELRIGSSLHDFSVSEEDTLDPQIVGPNAPKSIHYLLDTDGFLVKLVPDHMVAHHSDNAFWKGDVSAYGDAINEQSIGVEIVHDGVLAYRWQQRDAIKRLVAQYNRDWKSPRIWISKHRVVFHSDVCINSANYFANGKLGCPSYMLPYRYFGEDVVTSTTADATERVSSKYCKFLVGGMKLLPKDHDGDPPKYGGKEAPQRKNQYLVRKLQQSLARIGYSISQFYDASHKDDDNDTWVNGQTLSGWFDEATCYALTGFRVRFMGKAPVPPEQVFFDRVTALKLEAALMDMGLP